MPATSKAAIPPKRVPAAAESRAQGKPGSIGLSKAVATKQVAKAEGLKAPEVLKKTNGGTPKKTNGATLKKYKLRSNRYKIPDNEYAQLTALKQRALALGVSAKKSELLRAGLLLLATLGDVQLKKALTRLEFIKTGSAQ